MGSGQITIPKHIRAAAGVLPGSEVVITLEGAKIVITQVASHVKTDRRAKLRAAAAKVRHLYRRRGGAQRSRCPTSISGRMPRWPI